MDRSAERYLIVRTHSNGRGLAIWLPIRAPRFSTTFSRRPGVFRKYCRGTPGAAELREGKNDDGDTGFVGLCPPGKSTHRYQFVLYAVDKTLTLPTGATKNELLQALRGHVLAKVVLVGRYNR